jgi:hypothetical protein
MYSISNKSDCLTARPTTQLIWKDLLKNIPHLTSIHGDRRYPVIFGIRSNNVDLYFLRYFEEETKTTEETFSGLIAAYQPEQLVLSYLVEDTELNLGSTLPYTFIFYATKTPMINLFIAKTIWEESHYELKELLGKMEDPNIIETMNFAFKSSIFTLFHNTTDRKEEARQALSEWRTNVNWSFEDVDKGKLPIKFLG